MRYGSVHIVLTGSDIPGLISRANAERMVLRNVSWNGDLSVRLCVSVPDYRKLCLMAQKKGATIEVIKTEGLHRIFRAALKRPVLLVSVLIVLFLSLWLPTRVLFIAVEGNRIVPTEKILQSAEECGVRFGAKRSFVRSEIVKNNLLEAVPELQWAGINTKGCTAVISLREEPKNVRDTDTLRFSSIVADRDGVIVSCTVTAGSPACVVGQAVKSGEVLVSGYQDLGLIRRITRSQAEIFAQTNRSLLVTSPTAYCEEGIESDKGVCYSLIVGKKRINLSKGSGISNTGCDKIYREYYLTLPGGFVLPLAFAVERVQRYHYETVSMDEDLAYTRILDYANHYILNQMVSGKVLGSTQKKVSLQESSAVCVDYLCVEMIGRERSEEFKTDYGEIN